MQTQNLVTATVKYPALPAKDFGYGPRVNVVVILDDGVSQKLWGGPDSPIAKLKRGQRIQLLVDGDKYRLVSGGSPPPKAEAARNDAFEGKDKAAIAGYVNSLSKLYAFSFQEVNRQFEALGIEATEETLRCAASSIFISTSRKFEVTSSRR